jgi:hypothetical protein
MTEFAKPDSIIGIAVLQEIWIPGVYRIWLACQKKNGETQRTWVFIRDANLPGPDEVVGYGDNRNAIWKFKRRDAYRLDCSPSLNWVSWGFHNQLNWAVEYVEMVQPASKETENPPEHQASRVHYDINLIPAAVDRQNFIGILRARGILKPMI